MELPSFLQLAAFLKRKRGSPTGDEKTKNSRPTPSSARSSSPSSDGIPSTHSNSSGQDAVLTSSVGLGQTTGENVVETAGSTIQNESLRSSMCNREACNILSTRVKELEETVAGKERDLNTLREELATCKDFSVDASTGMLSFGMEADYVTHIERYQKRLEEFAEAVKERDGLIVQLSEKLKSSNQIRAALQTKEEQLAQDVALLQKQLHHTKEIVEGHVWDTGIKPQDFLSLQSQFLALEDTVTKNKSVINGLNAALHQRDMALQAQTEELEKKSQELSQHKTKSAKEIQELMREVEELNQRSVLSTNTDSKNLADLRAQLEEEFGLQLVQIKEEFRNQLDKKNEALQDAGNTITAQEHQLADTVTVFKSEILSYKLQVDALNVARQEAAAMVDRLTSELGSYNVDLALQKEQNQAINESVKDMTERNERLSRELLSLQSCQQMELSSYKKQIEDLSLQLQQSKERLHQGEIVHVSGEDPANTQRLKCQLANLQEKHIKEISQLRLAYTKELESFRQRNDSLVLELDIISRNKEKCTAELNACKEAYIAQWGSSKHAQDMEIVGLKEQISALKVQIQEVMSVKEISDNYNSNLETTKPSSETEANFERESLKLQVKDALLAQDSLSREITGHKLEIAMYKQEKGGLQESLNEMSMLEEHHRLAGLEQQRELDRYKHQVEDLNQSISSKEQEIEKLQESNLLQNELSRVSDLLSATVNEKETLSKRLEASTHKYTVEMASYEEKLRSINLEVDNLTQGHLEILSSYHEAQSLNTSLADQIHTLECEVLSYKKQLESAGVKALDDLTQANVKYDQELKECKESIETVRAQYKESVLVFSTYIKELQFWDQQIREFNSQLAKELNVEVPDIEVNISSVKPVHEQLLINIKNNFTTLQHFIKSREESFHSATSQLQDSTLKLLSAQSTLVSVTEKNKQLHDNSTLDPAVGEELAGLHRQLLERERLLETKTNSELALEKHIKNLESKLLQLSTNSASMKECLQETTVKLVAAEALSAAKDELEIGLKNRISELEEALHNVNEDSLSIRLESDQVTEKVAKAKDLLERMRAENNELSALCKLYEDDSSQLREQLLLSEQRVKNLLSQLKPVNEKGVGHTLVEEVCTEQTAPQLSTQTQPSRVLPTSATHFEQDTSQQQDDLGILALQIQQFEKYQEELVMRCNRYEEEVGRLREELVTSENSLESLRQEVSNNKSSQSLEQNSLSPPNRDETAMAQSETASAFNKRDVILSGGDSAPLNEYSFLGRGFDFGFNMSGQTLNNTEYMGMDDLKTNSALKLIENCSFLENVRNELVGNVQDLKAKIQEFELNEKFYKEELEMSNHRCQVFDAKLADQTKALETLECKIVSQSALENKILHLESEKAILQDVQANLHTELVTKQLVYEEKLSKMLHDQLSNSLSNIQGATIEEMISELGSKAKELIILSEKLKSKEETESALQARLRMMEESYQNCITQLACCKDEVFSVRKELEESWQKQRQTENELARVGRELKITQLSKKQLEKSQSRLKDVSTVENLESSKVSVLKQALLQASNNRSLMEQSDRSRIFTANDFSSSTYDLLDNQISTIREKLQCIIQKNDELFADGIDGAEMRSGKSDNHQTSLTAELSAYREQHATLAEVLGSTGILQEALHRQKQELLQKTHEKAAIDDLVEKERIKLHEAVLKIEMLQMDLQQRDDLQIALNRQKYLLAEELQEIEEKLSERECILDEERLRLEAEIRQRDLSIRQWQLKCRAQQVEHSTEQAVSQMTASPLPSPRSMATQQLDQVKSDLNTAHTQTLQRMRNHLVEQFSTSERKLQTSHRAELLSIHEEHQKKLATIQHELQDKTKELEASKQLENQQEKQLIDMDEWKNKLDEHQKEIYTQMRQQFESYAQHQIEGAMKRLQDEHELILSSQKAVHEQETRELQTKLEQQKEVELLHVKQTLTKQHNQELMELEEKLKAEVAHHIDITNPFPTDSKAAMLLLKQLVCCEFTASFKALADSRHETYRKEMAELISQLEEAMKREDLNVQSKIPQLLDSQENLLTQTEELLARVVTEHQCMLDGLEAALDTGHERLQAHLKLVSREAEAAATTVSLQDKITALEEEKQELLQQHTANVDLLTTKHGTEVARLQELLSVSGIECGPCTYLRRELEAKHTSEMEELRHYFEKKCTELEKHYSEEVFSQHSRKLSSSSSCESELASDIYYTGGEQGHRINTLTHMCDSYTVEPSYKELEEHYQRDYEKRIVEYRQQLDIIKHSIEEKYSSEMDALKEGYDMKVEELVRELAANHSVEIKELERKHLKDMENLRAQLGAEAKKNEDNGKNEVERIRQDLQLSHLQDLEKLKKTFEERLNVDIECLTDRMLQDEADHIRIIKEEMQEKHESEVARLKTTLAGRTEEHERQLLELEEKHQADLERERMAINEQVDELTAMMKRGSEHEQEAFLEAQKEMMQGFLAKHQEDLKALKEHHESQLRDAHGEVHKLQQEHAEYNEQIRQSKRRLHDEIQHDVLKALEDQLQVLLSEEVDEKSWPAELLQLQDKMSARYKREMTALHHDVKRLTDELERVKFVTDSVEEQRARAEPVDSVGVKQMAATLKCVIGEIVQYMSVCEEELNNTLVNQILKYDWENISANESTDDHASLFRDAPNNSSVGLLPIVSPIGNLNLSGVELSMHGPKSSTPHSATLDRSVAPSENESYSLECKVPRRVHFAPDISTIFSMDEASLLEYMDNKKELSTEFRTELDACLERLKAEAASLTGLSAAVPKQSAAMGERITTLSRQLANEVKAKDELATQLAELVVLKQESARQREQLDKLSTELRTAREKITELESKEDVTEGYGEQVSHNSLREGLAQLQDQAQTSENEGGVKSPHLHLIEELIREGDRLMEESKHEKDDLKLQVSFETSPSIAHMACCQQIAAADKQLRSTRQFLEQQALEREQERDEYLHEIENLQEQLKATDKDRSSNYLRAKEADSLEAQMKEVSGNLQEAQVRKDELEAELKAAIEKVWVLRDIITELESQVEIKSRHEATLRKQVDELEAVLEQQNQTNQELMRQLDSGNGELAEHVNYLEEQLHLHRQQMEHLQPDSVQVKQMKTQLREFETTLDKKTKDLESLYTTTLSNTSCSSPSEDVSFRDHLDVMRSATPDETPVSLPLDQLVRVQEKLNTHSRAEQATLKRIRDLEMQVKKLKSNEEEVTAERDVLQNQVDEQLLKISSIKAHLDEQRTKADELVQQASCDLEARLHQREMEIRDLNDAVENKEKQVAVAQDLLEETRLAVAAQEAEWSSRVNKEHVVVQKLKQEYNKLKAESGKRRQQEKQRGEEGEAIEDEQDGAMGKYIPIPVLIDTMLATKNAELEALSKKVDELEQQLRAYMSLDLTDEQRAKLNNMLKDVKSTKKDLQAGPSGLKKKDKAPRSTEVLYARQATEEDYSSGAESDMDENDLRNLLLRKESQILSLKNQLAAKELECAEKDALLNKALEKVESASDNISENTELRTRLKSMEDEQDELKQLRSESARLLAENEELQREVLASKSTVASLQGAEGAPQDEWGEQAAAMRQRQLDDEQAEAMRQRQLDDEQAAAMRQRELDDAQARRSSDDDQTAAMQRQLDDEQAAAMRQRQSYDQAAAMQQRPLDDDQAAAMRQRQLDEQAAAMQQHQLQEQAAAMQRQREDEQLARSGQDQRDGGASGGQGRWDQRSPSSAGTDSSSKAEKDALNRKLEEMRKERDALQSKVNEMSGLEAAYNDMQRKDKNLDNIIKERDMLRIRLDDYANMDEEMERLKYRAKEAEVMRMERDRIKAKLDELTTIEAAYLDLLDRSKNLEVIAAERELYKAKYEELSAQENKIEELEKELAELRGVDKERDFLIRQIMDMQCEIADQEDEIRRLVISVDHLARHSQKQEDQMSQSLSDLRTEVETKGKRIAELEAKMTECSALEDEIKSLRDQLKEAIEGVAQDKEEVKSELDKLSTSETRLKADLAEREARMAEREAALLEKQKQIEELQRNISQKDVALRSLSIEREATVHADDYDKLEMELENERRSTKALKDELNALQAENDRLQSELDVLLLKSGKSGTSDKRLSLDETQKQLESCTLELNDYMAKIQALQVENDALRNEVEALRAASGGDSQLEEELVKEKQARMYAERELRSALDKIEEMMANQDKQMEDRPAGRSSSCEEMIEHYKQKYEAEKQAKDMLQDVLDSKDDELEKEKESKKKLEEELNRLQNEGEKQKAEQRKSYEFMEQTKDEMEKLKAEIARLTIDVAKANEELEKSVANSSGNAAEEIGRLKAELEKITAERDKLLENSSQDDSEKLEMAQQEAEKLRKEIEQLTKDSDNGSVIAALQAELDELKKERDSLKTERDDLKAESDRMQSQFALAGSGSDQIKQDLLAQAHAEIQKLDSEINRLTSIVDKANADASSSDKAEIADLKAERDLLRAERDGMKAQLSSSATDMVPSNLLTDAQREIKQLNDKINQLTKDLENASSGQDNQVSTDLIKEAQTEVDKLKAEIARLNQELSDAKKDTGTDQAEIDSLKAQLVSTGQDKQQELDKLKAENARLIGQLDNAIKDAAGTAQSEIENLKSELALAGQDKDNCKQELDKLMAENARLIEQLDNAIKDVAGTAQSEIDNLKAQLILASQDKDNCKQELDKLMAENVNLIGQLDKASKDVAGTAPSEIENLKSELDLANQEKDNCKQELDKLIAENARLVEQLDKAIKDVAGTAQSEIENLKAQLAAASQDKDNCTQELDKLKADNARLIEQLDNAIKDAAGTAQSEIDNLKAQLDLAGQDKDNCKQELEKLKAENAHLSGQVGKTSQDKECQDTCKEDVEILKAENARLSKDIGGAAKFEIDNLKAQLASAGQDKDACKQELDKLKAENARLSGLLDNAAKDAGGTASAEIDNLKSQLASASQDKDACKQELDKLKAENARLSGLLDNAAKDSGGAAKASIENLKSQLASAGEDKDACKQELDKLKAENARLTGLLDNAAKDAGGAAKAEIDSLKAQLASAGQDKQQEVEKLKAENARLSGLLDNAAKDAGGAADAEIENLKSQLASASQDKGACKQELDKLKAENARLSDLLDNAEKDSGRAAKASIENLKSQLASAGQDKDACQQELDKLKAENARLTGLLDNAAKDSGNAAKAEIDNLKAQLASAGQDKQQELDKLKAEHARLSDLQDNATKDAVASAKAEIDSLKAQLASASKDSASAELLKQAQQEVDKLKAEIDRLNGELKNAGVDKAECEKLKNERDNLKSQLASVNQVKSELDNLKAERDKSKTMQDQQKQAEEEISKLKAEIARLKAQLESVTADATKSAKAEIDTLKDQLSKADKEQQNNRQLTDEVNQLKSDLARMATERDNLKKENDAREKLIKLSQGSLHDVVQEGKEKITDLQNTIKALERENESLRKALAIKDESTIDDAAEKAERGKLESIIKQLEGDINSLNKKMVEKEKELKSAKDAEPDVVKNLTSSLEAEQKRNQDLQDELKRLRASPPTTVDDAELDKLRKKCANLEAQIAKHDDDKKGLVDTYESKIATLRASYEEKMRIMNEESTAKLQASVEKVQNSLSPEDHLANVKKVEEKCEQKMKLMAEEYEKRLKDMAASHNVEMDQQQQMYNKNLDDLRTTYDRDMKVLNDRHNNSVLKLQKMHENEVIELNVEYEAEINTVRIASTDTVHTREKQHNAEMEKMKRAHEATLNDMEKRHQEEKDALTRKLDSSLDKVKELHKKEMQEWNMRFEKSLQQTKQENEAQLQRLKDANKKKIEALKQQYEQLMEDERRKHQEQLSKLKGKEGQLTQSKTETYVLGEDKVGALAGQVKKELDISADLDKKMLDRLDDMATRDVGLACSPSLTQILNKVLQQGIDSLTFDELSKLHQRTCAATSAMIMQNTSGRLPLEMVPTSMSPDQQGADKGVLCRRILALEGEIKLRQEEAKQNMCHLENKIRSEEKRLHEMRQVLMEEQRRNIDLHSKLGNQTRRESELESEREVLRRQSTYQEERMQQFLMNLEREKNKVRCLEENLQKERNNTRHLQSLLEADRFRGRNANIKETDIIETMRIKLENALDNEAKIRIRNEKLESQLRRYQMQPSTCPAPCNPTNRQYTNDMQSLLDAEVEKCGSLELALKREQLQVEQLQVQQERERQQAIERLEAEREKREKLRRQISSLEEEKENLSGQLDTARESLCNQRLISESLERKLAAILEMDVGKQRRRDEDDEKNRQLMEKQRIMQFDLEQKVLELQREVADMRDQISAGGDGAKVSDLRQQLSESLQREQQLIRDLMSNQPLDVGLSAPLLQKLKSMNALLETHVEENATIMAKMNQINRERQHLHDKVNSLEAQLANRSRSRNLENETEIVNGLLEAERTTWARERAVLDRALLEAEGRASRVLSENISKDDQARHLFGKYLRVESYRKALVWQKRYLLVVLSGYQEAEVKTVKRLSRMARANDGLDETSSDTLPSIKHTPVNKFRSCAFVVVAVHRMHYMVRRWRHSRQLGSAILFNRGSTESIPSSTQSSYFNGPRRKRSTSSCWSVPRSLSHADVPNLLTRESRVSHSLAHSMASREPYNRTSSSPTTDHVMAVRERYNMLSSSPNREQHMLRRWESDHVQHQLPRRSESVPETPPLHISEYINRFDQLQQTLSLNVAHMPSTENKRGSHTRQPPTSS